MQSWGNLSLPLIPSFREKNSDLPRRAERVRARHAGFAGLAVSLAYERPLANRETIRELSASAPPIALLRLVPGQVPGEVLVALHVEARNRC